MDEFSFEWDEAKREEALAKHGIDFLDAIEVFTSPHLRIPARSEVETRWFAIGMVNFLEITVVYTMREDRARIITARRARQNERKAYHDHLARRGAAERKPD